jgi:hypothetical protein
VQGKGINISHVPSSIGRLDASSSAFFFCQKGEGHTTRGAGVEQIWWSLVDRVRQGFSAHEFFFLAHAWTQLNIFILTFFLKNILVAHQNPA